VLFIWGKQWTAAEIAERKRKEELKKPYTSPKKEKYRDSYGWETCVKNCRGSYKLQAGQDACVKSCAEQYPGKLEYYHFPANTYALLLWYSTSG
jgi:hypothetical protein